MSLVTPESTSAVPVFASGVKVVLPEVAPSGRSGTVTAAVWVAALALLLPASVSGKKAPPAPATAPRPTPAVPPRNLPRL